MCLQANPAFHARVCDACEKLSVTHSDFLIELASAYLDGRGPDFRLAEKDRVKVGGIFEI